MVMATYRFFASLLLLGEVLSAVNCLSLACHWSIIDLTIIPPLLNSTVQPLEIIKQESFKANVEHLIAQTVLISELEAASNPERTMVITTGAEEPEKYKDQIRRKFVDTKCYRAFSSSKHTGSI